MRNLKIFVYFFILLLVFVLSGCALLLSQILTGTNQKQYTAYVYFNGLPKEIVDKTGKMLLKDIVITDILSSINFWVGDSSFNLQENDITYIVNGLNKGSPFTFVASESNKIDIEASMSIRYATDTTFVPYVASVSIGKREYSIPISKSFYVLIYATDNENKNISVLDYSKAYRFTIKTQDEEFVEIRDVEKTVYLFTKKTSEGNQCVFIGERGKTYTFYSPSKNALVTRTAPNNDA
ncbi:MAG: hypothetical protein N2Z58_06555, partial [Fervidobacterium sp.]|nr:hypothetical protein [Fervidobacterium sp.]